MSSLERVPRSDDPRFAEEKRKWMQEVLEALGGDMRKRLGDPQERFGICCENEIDPQVYHFIKSLDEDDVKVFRDTMYLVQGRKLPETATENAKDMEHMLADYRSARSIGKILKVVWIVLAGLITATVAFIKGLPDFLELLRGWLR